MRQVVLVVELDIKPESFGEFHEIVTNHLNNSCAIEPGCLEVRVLKPREKPHGVILIEVYEDDAALESHWNSPHMAIYRERVKDMIVSRTPYRCDT